MELLFYIYPEDSCKNWSLLYSWKGTAQELLIRLATHALNTLNKPQIRKCCLFVLSFSQQRNCAAKSEIYLIALNSVDNIRQCFIGLFESEHGAINRGQNSPSKVEWVLLCASCIILSIFKCSNIAPIVDLSSIFLYGSWHKTADNWSLTLEFTPSGTYNDDWLYPNFYF